jgi:uncharacterized membrane protein SirB2
MTIFLAYGGIKFLIFVLVVASGLFLMAAHSANVQTTRWKCFGVAGILWFAIIALASVK